MITVAEARAVMLEQARTLGAEHVPLPDARGRTLRERVVASRSQPPFAASAMDGYAVRSTDTPGVLLCVGEAGAGRAFPRALGPGECARIFTGAPMPGGADAVLIQEDAKRSGDEVTAPRVQPDKHVRRAGVDFAEGAVLLEPGRVLDPIALALAAASGCAELRVAKSPRVAILSGGDEIVAPGTTLKDDQIFDSVSYGVAGLAEAWGATVSRSMPFSDDPIRIARLVNDALDGADLAIIIGGASVGDHDHARPALRAIGAALLFEKVAVRPGKPTWFAHRDGQLVLGLPGNPASAFVCARLFLKPLLDRLFGRDPTPSTVTQSVRLRGSLAANGPRETYLRARTAPDACGQLWVEACENQDSSLISVFAASNALLLRRAGASEASEGDLVDVLGL